MVITKTSPLSILRHLRVVNSAFLKQRFDGCLFLVSFYLYIFFIIYNLFYESLYILHFIIAARSILNDIKKSFTEYYRMFKNYSMENLAAYRNQTINLQYPSIDWFLPDLSLHLKGLLNSPGCKHQIHYKTHKYDLKSIHFT